MTDLEQPQTSNCSIFDGVELCAWPVQRSRDVWDLRGRMFDHIQRQIWYLSGAEGEGMKWVRNGIKWYTEIKGVYYCQLRVLGTALVLNDAGHTTFKASSPAEAARIYRLCADAVLAGRFNNQLRDVLNRIPPREQ